MRRKNKTKGGGRTKAKRGGRIKAKRGGRIKANWREKQKLREEKNKS